MYFWVDNLTSEGIALFDTWGWRRLSLIDPRCPEADQIWRWVSAAVLLQTESGQSPPTQKLLGFCLVQWICSFFMPCCRKILLLAPCGNPHAMRPCLGFALLGREDTDSLKAVLAL